MNSNPNTNPCRKFLNEPQTADYQAAVDNVWFENSRNASSIRSSWAMGKRYEAGGRTDYLVSLEMQLEWELGRKSLGYSLDCF